jgi:hypothetical protein
MPHYHDPHPEICPRNTGMVRIEAVARELNGFMIQGDTMGAEMRYRDGELVCILDFGLGNEFGKVRRDARPIIVQLNGKSDYPTNSPADAVARIKTYFDELRRRSRPDGILVGCSALTSS